MLNYICCSERLRLMAVSPPSTGGAEPFGCGPLEGEGVRAMTITLSVTELCQIALVVLQAITLYRVIKNDREKKE